jgi:hypothetical protein
LRSSLKIISGGQTGVDRAALDFALENQIPCGGWCPKGRIAEDGPIPFRYPLRETDSTDYRVRTKANVRDSDATLILFCNELGNGTGLTKQFAEKLNKPYFLLRFGEDLFGSIGNFHNWMKMNRIKTLNIAGPRESSEPGIYDEALSCFEKIFAPR